MRSKVRHACLLHPCTGTVHAERIPEGLLVLIGQTVLCTSHMRMHAPNCDAPSEWEALKQAAACIWVTQQ